MKQEFKEKLKNDKFFHDIVKNKIVNDSVHSIGQSLVDPMYAKIKQETDTKFNDLKAEFDLDNRIKAAINVAMA